MLREKLNELISAIQKQDDCGAEYALEKSISQVFGKDADYTYGVVEEDEWTQDHKYQNGGVVIKLDMLDETVYLSISMSRSGSYHTDWYYTIDWVGEVKPATITTVETRETFISIDSDVDKEQYVCIKVTGEDAKIFCDQVEESISERAEGFDVEVSWES